MSLSVGAFDIEPTSWKFNNFITKAFIDKKNIIFKKIYIFIFIPQYCLIYLGRYLSLSLQLAINLTTTVQCSFNLYHASYSKLVIKPPMTCPSDDPQVRYIMPMASA